MHHDHALALIPSAAVVPLDDLTEQARDFLDNAKAPATRRAYRCDWRHFTAWCDDHALLFMPATPETVALYLTAQVGRLKPSTLQRRISAISQAHEAAGHETPTKTAIVRTRPRRRRRSSAPRGRGSAARSARPRPARRRRSPAPSGR